MPVSPRINYNTLVPLALLISLFAVTALAPITSVQGASSAGTPLFSKPINLSTDHALAQDPNVQNAGSHEYVVWTERSDGIRFRESPDGGVTWVPPLNMSSFRISNVGGTSQYPLMSENGTNVYIVWAQSIGATGL
jgi:hypothetical protein